MVYGQFLAIGWWLAGGWRVYQLARFFQLEGYKSERFLRWAVTNKGERWYLAKNLLIFVLLSVLFGVLKLDISRQTESDQGNLSQIASFLLIASFLSIVLIVLRQPQREIKQQFTRTPRAIRILITAIVLTGAFELLLLKILPLAASPLTAFSISVCGFIAFLLAPLTLPLANMLMTPVEAVIRQSYLRNAQQALDRAHPTVIAITGSYGKTTTKEYIAHLIGGRYRVLKTPKSYNTLMGVTKVINQILANDQSYDYFIVEMGAYITGEIAAICRLTKPAISLVTAVGPMHLERFGSIDNTARAKYEIIEALPPDGLAVFNDDDPRVKAMHDRGYPAQRVGVTRQDAADARLSAHHISMTIDGLAFDVRDAETGEERHVSAPVYGDHNVSNILMALAVAQYVGLSLAEAVMRVATLEPAEHRLVRRVLPNGVITIDDAYSTNPIGTRQALRVLALNTGAGRRVAITSGMVELGPIQDDENCKLGSAIAAVATDVVLINGRQTAPIQQGLQSANFPVEHLHIVETTAEAVNWMLANTQAGDAVLIMSDLPDTY